MAKQILQLNCKQGCKTNPSGYSIRNFTNRKTFVLKESAAWHIIGCPQKEGIGDMPVNSKIKKGEIYSLIRFVAFTSAFTW
jgi:hypothetical protein